jgi:secreted PhoX family phosphatase
MRHTRRELIGATAGAALAVTLGARFWDDLFGAASSARLRPGLGYGPRRPPDALGLRLPARFSARIVARGGEPVGGTSYVWHEASDGAATFPLGDGGWILVSNSETLRGGASTLRFRSDGRVIDAYGILDGTRHNCSGGGTPWGTWLSCEEVEDGLVWECDPGGRKDPVSHPALGVFKHEAAAVDPRGRRVYLTEDLVDGRFYRFTPERWPRLERGVLELATVSAGGEVRWTEVPDPSARHLATRRQLPDSTPLKRGEGIWRDGRTVYVATTADHRVHAYDIDRGRMRVIYDGLATRSAPLLRVDQLTANRAGEVFVCEDIATDEIDIGLIERSGRVSRFLSATGPQHVNSELTGVAFDPSGSRMYFSSQRAGGSGSVPGPGAIYEISGPFRGRGSQTLHPRVDSA